MHIDMAVVCVLLSAILGCMIAFPIWVVKSFNEASEKAAAKLEAANRDLNQKLATLQLELENGRVKRHEQAARIISLSDNVARLANEFEKMRDKMQEHIEHGNCPRK